MCPFLNDGDWILVRFSHGLTPKIDSVVVATHPETGSIIVKRVRSVGNRAAYLGSDNPNEGTDSRHFGSVPFKQIHGQVVRRYHR